MDSTFNYKIFADCGAPSLYNKLSRKTGDRGIMGSSFKNRKYDSFSYTETAEYDEYRTAYITFLKKHKHQITTYSNLDVINNPDLTYRNQLTLEAQGLNPIPVFHIGSNLKWLRKLLRKYEYIALGGLVPNTTAVLIPLLDRLFKEELLDSNGLPKVKLHGFACTSIPLMLRYPWYSVDSATCRKLAGYGSIVIPNFTQKKLIPVQISSRDTPLRYKFTEGLLNSFNTLMEKHGTNTFNLSTLEADRMTWNYLMYSLIIQKSVPNWPWSFSTRKQINPTNELMCFYFAGAYHLEKEVFLWNTLKDKGIDNLKGRLQSFFYRTSLEATIKLKYTK